MFWPFNIPAKRREREAQQRRDEEARQHRIKDDIEAENRRQRRRESLISQPPAMSRPFSASASNAPAHASSSSVYSDPINPLSPLNPINQAGSWSAPADEPRHSHSHCGSSSSHSSSDYGSSHSSSHDHGCSSSSYDSGSSSSNSDW